VLPASLQLAAGTQYWINIEGTGGWSISQASGGSGSHVNFFVGLAMFLVGPGNPAFTLIGPSACYANCDGSTTAPVLNVLDFSCFLNKFASGDTYANCDHSTTTPVLNVLDFACFLNKFAAGCS
jgi:hypothetical protein